MTLERPKPVVWVGSSLRDMRELPASMRRSFGVSLFAIQCGETPPAAKLLKGLGGGVLELVEHERGGTYRAVYAVRFETAICAACLSEEVEVGQGDATAGHRSDQTAPHAGRGIGSEREQ